VTPRRVVIVGAGFGGLNAARALRGADVHVVIIDQHNYNLFQPLLYQVGSGMLDPGEIAHPVRSILRGQRNLEVRLGTVTGIDLAARMVTTDKGDVSYDSLIVAAGSVTNHFGNAALARSTNGLKTLDDAIRLRSSVLECFERADEEEDEAERRRLLTVVIAGGGPTGMEYAGALMELFTHVLPRDYPHLDFSAVRVVIVEGADRLLDSFHPQLAARAQRTLRARGVELVFGRRVVDASEAGVRLDDGTTLDAATVVWTAGVRAVSLGGSISDRRGRLDRVPVRPTLQLPGQDDVYVIGDLAEVASRSGEPLPMLAPVAIQQGRHAAKTILVQMSGAPAGPFRYLDKGTMATVGRNQAVVQVGPLRYSGFVGWLTWLFLHLLYIVTFRSKVMVLLNWGWNYLFYDRPIRLITSPRARGAEDPVTPQETSP
jgi:NADH dehydrogenase